MNAVKQTVDFGPFGKVAEKPRTQVYPACAQLLSRRFKRVQISLRQHKLRVREFDRAQI
jgi:hypothetical protein